jgi:hypothetical protein
VFDSAGAGALSAIGKVLVSDHDENGLAHHLIDLVRQESANRGVGMLVVTVEDRVVVIDHIRHSQPAEQTLSPGWKPRPELRFEPHEIKPTAPQQYPKSAQVSKRDSINALALTREEISRVVRIEEGT